MHRKPDVLVAFLHQLSFRFPMRAQNVLVESMNHGINLGSDLAKLVAPEGEDSLRLQDAMGLCKEVVLLEPMEGLRHRDDIDAMICQTCFLSGFNPEFNLEVMICARNLLGARIRRDHALEALCELKGGLTVAGAAIPGKILGINKRGQVLKKPGRIRRSKPCVVAGLFAKEVFEIRR